MLLFFGTPFYLSQFQASTSTQGIKISLYYQPSYPFCKEDFGAQLQPGLLNKCQHVCCDDCFCTILSNSNKCPFWMMPFNNTIFYIYYSFVFKII
jgi:hypothetical protein